MWTDSDIRGNASGYVAISAACGAGALFLGLWFGADGTGLSPDLASLLPTAAPWVSWALPLVRLAQDICATVTVGALLTGAVLLPVASLEPGGRGARCVRAAGTWSLGWAVAGALSFVLTLVEVSGGRLSQVGSADAVVRFAFSIPQGQAFLMVELAALTISTACGRPAGALRGRVLLGVAILGLLPSVYVSHASSTIGHDIAVSAMMVHIVAAAGWAGGLAGILLYLRDAPELLPESVRRFSVVALGCFVAAGVSGLAGGWIRLGVPSQLWGSQYGLLLIAKILALVVLGVFGLRHRRATIVALVDGHSRRPFLRLATGEIAVMAATIGLAVALSRAAPPAVPNGQMTWVEFQLGYDLRSLTLERLLTGWRPDPLIALLLLAAGVAYGAGIRRLARRGVAWSRGRGIAWFAGLALLALVLLTGVATYARGMFSLHSVQYAVLTLVSPALLAYGAPATLLRQARNGPVEAREEMPGNRFRWWTTEPIAIITAYAVSFLLFYFTGWFAFAQQLHLVHLASQAVFLAVGFLFFQVVVGADPGPMGAPIRLRLLFAGLAVHVLLAAVFLLGPLIAESWYRQLGLMWASLGSGADGRAGGLRAESAALVLDQRIGAAIGGAVAVVVLAALVLRARSDGSQDFAAVALKGR